MHTPSSTDAVPFIQGQISIHSQEDLEVLATRLSTALGGMLFGGRDEQICDEVPAVYADVAGLRFVLQGYAHEHYILECYPAPSLPAFGDDTIEVDVSRHLLRAVGELTSATTEL